MSLEEIKQGKVFLIDKPLQWTSFQVVNKLRWHIKKHYNIKKIKVGHAGTLDPLATGLLIVCVGKETKNIHTYQGQIKTYTGIISLGATTPSYDLETEINQTFSVDHINKDLLEKVTPTFIGEIDQKPPIFSAIKKDGKRLYELARKGENTEIKSRKITIKNFELTSTNIPNIGFTVVCSKGTYIRSLAYDFGCALDSGAHLSKLRRTKIGDFSVENAISVEEFSKIFPINA